MSNQDTGNGKFVTVTNLPPEKPGMDKKTAEWLSARHEQIETDARKLIEIAMTIGEVLYIVQEKSEQGSFLQWLSDGVCFSQRTAYKYMALFNNKEKVSDAKNLSEAYKKIEASMTIKKEKEAEEAKERVHEYERTGKKPAGWRKNTDDSLAKRMRLKRDEEPEEEPEAVDVDIIPDEKPSQKEAPKRDIKGQPLISKKPENKPENDLFVTDDLMEYLNNQPNDSRRAMACKAIIRKCREVLDDCMA